MCVRVCVFVCVGVWGCGGVCVRAQNLDDARINTIRVFRAPLTYKTNMYKNFTLGCD